MTDATAPPDPIPAPLQATSTQFSKITLKTFVIGAIGLGLMLPLWSVQSIVSERQTRFDEAVQSIGASWGPEQRLVGPVLSLTYSIPNENPTPSDPPRTETVTLLPDRLQFDVKLRVEKRQRGPFEASIYRAEIVVDGEFLLANIAPRIGKGRPDWRSAELRMSMSDLRSVEIAADATIGGSPVAFVAAGQDRLLGATVRGELPMVLDPQASPRLPFRVRLAANGSKQFAVVPMGRETKMTLSANWDAPSFAGASLPTTWSRQPDGFTANWQVGHLGRGLPQVLLEADTWPASKVLPLKVLTVDLLTPVTTYRLAERATKYGILFILLTFAVFLLSERVSGHVLHVVQYGLVGSSLCLFFLILLALGEHAPFPAAFSASASAVVVQSGLYVRAATRNWWPASIHAAMIGGLYGFLYVLLQLEDHALLAGAGLLFVVISVLMFATRNLAQSNTAEPASA